ncbi:MAG: diacylglycerol kinase family lipid kinase [Lachnospiraceae bacterium]|nr:diacylglycerol kinase family lipid kinase [Lachnospiraceae bacterium]
MHYIIYNPTAQSAGKDNTLAIIRHVFSSEGVDCRFCATEYPGHAEVLAAEISESDPEAVIVAVGGDGSIHEIINGLKNLDTVTLAVVPHGSGNDFAKGMGISSDPLQASLAAASPGKIRHLDIGVLSYGGRRERFCVSCGIGFDAAVCHEALDSPIKDFLNSVGAGQLSYTMIAGKQIALYKAGDVKVRVDGDKSYRFPKTYFVAVMNQKYEGGGVMMTPEALPDDGKLDVFVCAGIPKAVLVGALPLARYGAHTRFRGLHFIRAEMVEIRADRERPVHMDGESGGLADSLTVGLEPVKLKVITE